MQQSIARFFVDAFPIARGRLGQAVGESVGAQFAMVVGGEGRVADADRCREALESLAPGGYLAVALSILQGGRFQRAVDTMQLPFRARGAERALVHSGARIAGRYGVSPDLDAPMVVYQLGSASARYSERHLLLSPRSWPLAALCGALRLWAGCDPSLGAILVVGRKP